MPIAAALVCLVIGIADGEMPAGMENIKVRLAEIDAPEKAQPFGHRSKQHLADLCFKKPATVNPQTTDRYMRTVARVERNGTDASAEQVRAGMAWVFDRYATDRSLYAVQEEARAAGRGLWVERDPMAPWEWRKGK